MRVTRTTRQESLTDEGIQIAVNELEWSGSDMGDGDEVARKSVF
jgi:hypothetical protein